MVEEDCKQHLRASVPIKISDAAGDVSPAVAKFSVLSIKQSSIQSGIDLITSGLRLHNAAIQDEIIAAVAIDIGGLLDSKKWERRPSYWIELK